MPVLATIAPIVASGVLFLLTRSSFALVFAALGPIIAVASAADSAIQRRRALRSEGARFREDARATEGRLRQAHLAELAELTARQPPVDVLARHLEHNPTRWRNALSEVMIVRVGTATVASTVRYAGGEAAESHAPEIVDELEALRLLAADVDSAPFALDLAGGVGLAGPRALALAAARSIILQLAHYLSPVATVIEVPAGADWEWLRELPGATSALDNAEVDCVRFVDGSRALPVVVASIVAELPRGLGKVLTLNADARAMSIGLDVAASFDPDYVGVEAATMFAASLAELAVREGGVGVNVARLPDLAEFSSLPESGAGALAAVLGPIGTGFYAVDLAADGPHAIVGGTTGSGKSELLTTWVLGMAATRAPEEVSFLFIDFKGGATFDALHRLPHCVGVITDLDAEQSLRAISSLSAELRSRERRLAANGLRSIDDANGHPPFPRLVVVVDEYAALLETHESLHTVFADIAARGRSLGMHLILCTQRPAGVVRDSILANCALRLSLRVHSAADSVAVLGTDAASALPARPPGRALSSVAGATPTAFQVALARASDVDTLVERWRQAPLPRPPWRPPLPNRVALDRSRLDADTDIPFALVDLPAEQRRDVARYRPPEHGSLLVVGAGGAGKSGLLAALASAPSRLVVESVGGDLPALWDALVAEPAGRLLLIDDIDAVIAACPDEYQGAVLDLLTRLLREGPARGTHAVLTAQRVSGAVHGLSALCGSVLTLRMPNRQEHVLAGGDPVHFLGGGAPGAGHWHGSRIQVFETATHPMPARPVVAEVIEPTRARLAFVSSSPDACAALLRELAPERRVVVLEGGFGAQATGTHVSVGDMPDILVADPESWQSQWTLFGSVRRTSQLVFDGCSVAEVRSLCRSRVLPPPCARGARALWIAGQDGSLARAVWPAGVS